MALHGHDGEWGPDTCPQWMHPEWEKPGHKGAHLV